MNSMYMLEDYKSAKTELLSTIESQFRILSGLVTVTAAVFLYLFDIATIPHIVTGTMIVPCLYSFFGMLWLDQVFRQRRLAIYILKIEQTDDFYLESDISGPSKKHGWENFIYELKEDFNSGCNNRMNDILNRMPSRLYYFVCLALFYIVPVMTYVLTIMYSAVLMEPLRQVSLGWFFENLEEIFINLPDASILGIVVYALFIIFSSLYIYIIVKLGLKRDEILSQDKEKKTQMNTSCVEIHKADGKLLENNNDKYAEYRSPEEITPTENKDAAKNTQ